MKFRVFLRLNFNLILMKNLLLSFALFAVGMVWGQKVNIQNNTPEKIKPGQGWSYWVGGTEDKVYYVTGDKESKKKIIALNRKTLKQVAEIYIMGKGSARQAQLKDVTLADVAIVGDQLWLTYDEKGKKNVKIFVEKLDGNLKQVAKPTLAIDLTPIMKDKEQTLLGYRIISSENNQKIGLVAEVSGGKNMPVEMIYLTSEQFGAKNIKRNKLDVLDPKRSTKKMFGAYQLLSNGDLIGIYTIKEEKDKENSYFHLMHLYSPEMDEMITEKFEHPKYTLGGMRVVENGKKTTLVGAYYDGKGSSMDGIYSASINPRSRKVENLDFTEFTKKQKDEMYQRSDDKSKKTRSKKAKEKDGSIILGIPVIEKIKMNEDGEIFAFISMMHNFIVRECTGSGSTRTCYDVPYCRKSDVITVKIDSKDRVEWVNAQRRSIVYQGWNISDVEVMQTKDQWILFYGNNEFAALGAENLSRSELKAEKKEAKKQMKRDKKTGTYRFKYSVVESNGTGKEVEYELVQKNKKKSERIALSPTNFLVLDDGVYGFSAYYNVRGWMYIPPLFLAAYVSPGALVTIYATPVKLTF